MTSHVISLDIGSTWTKGALWSVTEGFPTLQEVARTPTTIKDLGIGVFEIVTALSGTEDIEDFRRQGDHWPVYYSSSAKGGLSIAVVGLVPQLSAHVGRLAAWSSGGRITHLWSWTLTEAQVKQIEDSQPDIILLTGGTDGGHEKSILHNARVIGASQCQAKVIYAGNQTIASEVERLLQSKRCLVVPNLMPDLETTNALPCQQAIRKEYLDTIVEGRGLSQLVEVFGRPPLLTPAAMLSLVTAIDAEVDAFKGFVLVDMGGATTDVYSTDTDTNNSTDTIRRGIIEPRIKRSVEGDLGLRVSALALLDVIEQTADATVDELDELRPWCAQVHVTPSLLPSDPISQALDRTLAVCGLWHSVARHAGRIERIWTSNGRVPVQRGKDLSSVSRLVLTGGWMAAHADADLWQTALATHSLFDGEKEIRVPHAPKLYIDQPYLWPLYAPLVPEYPLAARAAVESLTDKQN